MGFPGAVQIIERLYHVKFVYGEGFNPTLRPIEIELSHNLMKYCYDNNIDALKFISDCEKNNKNALIESGAVGEPLFIQL